jgi:hypothetical protein
MKSAANIPALPIRTIYVTPCDSAEQKSKTPNAS